MSVTSVVIRKENLESISVHNPSNIFVDVTFSGLKPSQCTVSVSGDTQDNLTGYRYPEFLGTFYPIIYEINNNVITYRFDGENILKSFLYDFSDTFSEEKVLEFLPNMSRNVNIIFTCDGVSDNLETILLNASTQIGEDNLNLDSYFRNNIKYFGGEEMPIYIYFFNNDEDNVITITDPSLPVFTEEYCFDYDDVVFMDFDDYYFKMNAEEII